MPDQHHQAQHSKQGMADPKASGGWEKRSSGGERANAQTQASNSYPEAIQRWIQESDDDAPWNAVGCFQPINLARKGHTGEEKTSTNGAIAGSKTSASGK